MIRYMLEIDATFELTLNRLARTKRTTVAEVLSRALATYQFLNDELRLHPEHKVSIVTDGGEIMHHVALP